MDKYPPGSGRGQVAVVAYLVPVVDLEAASPTQRHMYGHSTAENLRQQDWEKLYTAFLKVYY